ncbi:MAG: metallophosphoesterase [Candidatus Nanoarchaeia archaeon]|nr:metallophosphoesterase [Candidatus Nanoarchaeia archaeon]MDD5357774.1 metallophosphoesterase [Candidatus Nanoarchaeia archaeon]MDD5588693.1 metallophosphoesterase [Candidatus Nanoarchaeia archaeon]
MKNYIFLGKTIFFPEKGILAVGDLHLGFEYKLQQSGVLVPEMQIEEVKKELAEIFEEIKKRNLKLKKIVFIGDIKHSFSYEWKEKNYFNDILKFLKGYIDDKKVILIKGNHDTIDYSFSDRLKDYFIDGDLAFTHGHKLFPEIFGEKIKTIVIGHLHPSIILAEESGVKREKYKCFLVGKFKRKNIIILPSFLATIEGTTINSIEHEYEDYFSIIPKRNLKNFVVYAAGKNEVYNFGTIKELVDV